MFKGETGIEIPDEYQRAFERVQDLEELLQNNITIPITELQEAEIAALRGLWRGRNRADKEKRDQT